MTAADAAVIALLIGFVIGWAFRAARNLPRMRRVQRRRPMAMYVDRAPDDRCKRNGTEAVP